MISHQKVSTTLKKHNIDAFLITDAINKKYLVGLDSEHGYVIATNNKIYLIIPELFYQYTKMVVDSKKVCIKIYKNNPFEVIDEITKKHNLKRLGFEEDSLTFKKWKRFSKKKPSILELIPISSFVESLRSIKAREEVEIIKKAIFITEKSIKNTLSNIETGLTEIDLEKQLEKEMYSLGADGFPFRFEISTGLKSAYINSTPQNNFLEKGELLLIDVGIDYKHYKTDIARTYAISWPTEEQLYFYNIVYLLLDKIVKMLKPGLRVKDICSIANDYFKDIGLDHGLPYDIGHGIGLEIHESPFLSIKSEEILEEGMVLSIEPGIYLKKLGGIRVEDIVLITDKGAELLSNSNNSLPIINIPTERR